MFNVTSATGIAYQLGQNNKNLQRSLQRLSTMQRINSGADDPGGLAVSMKLGIKIRQTEAAISNMSNAKSYLETQDGVLSTAADVLEAMGAASINALGTTNTTMQALYELEFSSYKQQLSGMLQETFNGEAMFSTDADTLVTPSTATQLTISLTGQTMSISKLDLSSVTNLFTTVGATSSGITTALSGAIDNLASLRTTNGSEQNRMGFASDLLEVNKINLEAANSRIVDLDVATEMVSYSKYKFLEESNLALLAQANARSEKLLKLLE